MPKLTPPKPTKSTKPAAKKIKVSGLDAGRSEQVTVHVSTKSTKQKPLTLVGLKEYTDAQVSKVDRLHSLAIYGLREASEKGFNHQQLQISELKGRFTKLNRVLTELNSHDEEAKKRLDALDEDFDRALIHFEQYIRRVSLLSALLGATLAVAIALAARSF